MSKKLKRFILSALALTATSLIMRTVSLSFNAYITRKVGAECIGLFTVVMSVYGFCVTFATSGINLACTRLVSGCLASEDYKGARTALRTCVFYSAVFGSVASVMLFLFAKPIGVGLLGDIRTVKSLQFMAVSMLPIALSSCFNGYFIAVRKAERNAITQIFEQAVKIFLITYLLSLLMPSGIEYACLALVGGGAIAEFLSFFCLFLLYLIENRKKRGIHSGKCGEFFKKLFGITVPVSISSYVRSLLLTVEHILIPKRLSARDKNPEKAIASYGSMHGMSIPLVLYPFAFIGSFAGLLIPEMSESLELSDKKRIKKLTERSIDLTLLFSIGVAGIMIAFSYSLGTLIYSSTEVSEYVKLLSALIPIMYLDSVVDCILKGIGEQVYSMGVNISDSLLSIILVWFLLPIYGAVGYIAVMVIAEIYNFSLSASRLHKKTNFSLKPLTSILIPFACMLISCRVIPAVLFENTRLSLWSCALQILICSLFYLVSAFVLRKIAGLISSKNRQRIK